jgi:TldD protein
MRDRLTEALKKNTADYCEIRFETQDETGVAWRGREIESVRTSKTAGGLVRACQNGGWGLAFFDALDNLADQVAEACRCAAWVGREKTVLGESPPTEIRAPAKFKRDFRGVALDEKIKLTAAYNDLILKHDPCIETSRVSYAEEFRAVHYVNSRGVYFFDERPLVSLGFSAAARSGSMVQRAFDGFASVSDFDVVLNRERTIAEVAARAAALLSAPQCEGGKYTVILNPQLGGVFAHEAFGHLSEADFLYENPKMRELMALDRKMGVPELNIVDDGSLGSYLGTHPCDDEGTPTQKTNLIKNGVLAGHLHSLETAAKMGARPTGNARAINRRHPPIVRMTNTYVEPGRQTFDELLKDVERGIYACDAFGGQTMLEMFTFSAGYARRIEHGKLGELVRDVVLSGNVFDTLHAMDGFGDDLVIDESPGGCGKGGQSPLPVTCGSPHLRIRDVVVGGK